MELITFESAEQKLKDIAIIDEIISGAYPDYNTEEPPAEIGSDAVSTTTTYILSRVAEINDNRLLQAINEANALWYNTVKESIEDLKVDLQGEFDEL